ncbi:hypothetical protein [Nocardioides aquiterrae]|uniref:Uncharacterized protein n=1 Tax=Nocardioides aquiterrae TaxID=203799 RepID=A0ABP4F2P9_9ACTN
MTDQRDEHWLRERLAAAVPDAPSVPGRAASARDRRRRQVRRTTALTVAGAVLVVLATVVPLALRPPADEGGPTTPSPTGAQTSGAGPDLTCGRSNRGGGGGVPPDGAVAIRLCDEPGMHGAPAPTDVLTSGIARVLGSLRDLPAATVCIGGLGSRYTMLVGYPDGTVRHVGLDMSACGTVTIGRATFGRPDRPYEAFLAAIRAQRRTTAPPDAPVAAPTCPRFGGGTSPLGEPGQIVAARLCVGYGEPGSGETSVEVPADDLDALLVSWAADPHHPASKGPGCSPVTPSWELAGVNAWGDRVIVEAECGVPRYGDDEVVLDEEAQGIIDRLVLRAGFPSAASVVPGDVAWKTAEAYIDDVNFGHREAAAALWQGDPQLPADGTVLDLVLAPPGCRSLTVEPWRFAWSCRYRAASTGATTTFTMVRDARDEIWRISSVS